MKEWFKDWFESEEYLEVYQHRNDEDANRLIELILHYAKISKDEFILDAACGAGRHSVILASKGFKVVGFDLSKTLLRIASNNIKQKLLNVHLLCGDFRNIAFKKRFDLILNLFTSFGYFESDEENFKFIRNAHSFLNNKKYYILDYLNEKYLQRNLITESVKEINKKTLIERRKIINKRVQKEIIIRKMNEERTFIESVRIYSKEEIINEFSQVGFKLDELFGDYNGSEYNERNSSRLIMFFKK